MVSLFHGLMSSVTSSITDIIWNSWIYQNQLRTILELVLSHVYFRECQADGNRCYLPCPPSADNQIRRRLYPVARATPKRGIRTSPSRKNVRPISRLETSHPCRCCLSNTSSRSRCDHPAEVAVAAAAEAEAQPRCINYSDNKSGEKSFWFWCAKQLGSRPGFRAG